MNKIPLKGSPNFICISESKLNECIEAVQQLVFSYKYYDADITKVLSNILKSLQDERTERLASSAISALNDSSDSSSSISTHRVKPVKIHRSK